MSLFKNKNQIMDNLKGKRLIFQESKKLNRK